MSQDSSHNSVHQVLSIRDETQKSKILERLDPSDRDNTQSRMVSFSRPQRRLGLETTSRLRTLLRSHPETEARTKMGLGATAY